MAGCSSAEAGNGGNADDDKLSIVATIFPEYDWAREIVGDTESVELTLLLDSGVDLHSYQPTAEDIIRISTCDLFIYVGGESDDWVEGALREAANEDMTVICLLDVLGDAVKTEETVEGMQEEHEHEDGEDHEHEEAVDEHVWLSLKNAELFCAHIASELERLDSANAAAYAANAEAYMAELAALDAQYEEAVDAAAGKTLLFGDRFPFRYLV
ncbi:MAG: metal ABC transporter substrate-binding protein, partial [Oscillospiraceae bacterium]|nr:metal ABC transporter substrate-binding protein [Oscillospiraceae bacterium]